MEVRCDRCGTEYDFDDALVSERGTTVRCTNCSHQFKVFPAQSGSSIPEIWVVRTQAGHQFTFTSLRELQSGLAAGRIGPNDELERGGRRARPLRTIAELEPFFRRQALVARGGTLSGVAPPNWSPGKPETFAVSQVSPEEPPSAGLPVPSDPEIGSPARADDSSKADAMDPSDQQGTLTRTLPSGSSEPPTVRSDSGATARETQPTGHEHYQLPDTRAGRPGAPESQARDPEAGSAQPNLQAAAGPNLGSTLRSESFRRFEEESSARRPEHAGHESARAADSAEDAFERARAIAPLESSPANELPAEHLDGKTLRRPFSMDGNDPATLPAFHDDGPSVEADLGRARELPPAAVKHPERAGALPEEPGKSREPSPESSPEPEPSEPFFTGPQPAVGDGDLLREPDSRYQVGVSRRVARSRWIVALVLVGALTLGVLTVVRRFLAPAERPSYESPPSPSAHRQVHEVTRTAIALLERGELDRAGEKLAEARLVAERDPAVVTALARLANVRADLVWQRLRFLDAADREVVEQARRQLETAVAQAQTFVDAAGEVAPRDARVLRTRVDWLRLKGELAKARELVAPLAADVSDPANAYVLAALDLAEPAPVWPSVIDRLRKASASDQGLGLARAALVYSLARAGQLEEARVQLARIGTDARPYPSLGELAAFVRRMAEPPAPSPGIAPASRVDARATPAERARVEDLGDRLNRARAYTKQGEYASAEAIYRAVLKQDRGNTEALAGLADLARSKNEPNTGELYDQVLAKNPSYLPALMARADLKWSGGDKAGAVTLYRRILEQAGQGSEYGQRAAARLAEAGTAASKTRSVTPKAAPGY
jgi:predicted Zn finger-like uncharacterized protein